MLRNFKDERLQKWHSLSKKSDELYAEAYHTEYIELPEKRFMGWEAWVGLTDARSRSKDAPLLNHILDILGASNKRIFRNLRYLKLIRRNQYKIIDFPPYAVPQNFLGSIYHYTISEHTYLNLTKDIQKYFIEDVIKSRTYYPWRKGKIYHLKYGFPTYELRWYVKKCYATHEEIPKHKVKAEADRIYDYLKCEVHYFSAKILGKRYRKDHEWNRQNVRTNQKKWSNALKVITKERIQDEELIDKKILKSKIFKHKV